MPTDRQSHGVFGVGCHERLSFPKELTETLVNLLGSIPFLWSSFGSEKHPQI